ncbi:hypothetical protein [Paenibacillus alkalitolerans]|uniref:hypothetical protein n=1 Tax=Paenibacillus alkalitolerans TaxID=2799335 RepID=UPI0018F6B953|nr:hypothetical protein [Paenibacillus alkalitolerans]
MLAKNERFIHPNVDRWIKSNVRRKLANTYREELQLFLQEWLGPIVNYDFQGLKAGYPYLHFPFNDSLYLNDLRLGLAFEIVGDTIVEGKATQEQYNKFLMRQNVLRIKGWQVVTFCKGNLEDEEHTKLFRKLLEKLYNNSYKLSAK